MEELDCDGIEVGLESYWLDEEEACYYPPLDEEEGIFLKSSGWYFFVLRLS